jgi:hypothetical protein
MAKKLSDVLHRFFIEFLFHMKYSAIYKYSNLQILKLDESL